MLQSLLSERFRAAVRREIKQLPIYALVVARKDGKLGPRLLESKKGGCKEADPANPFAVDSMHLCGNWMLGPAGSRRATVSSQTRTARESSPFFASSSAYNSRRKRVRLR